MLFKWFGRGRQRPGYISLCLQRWQSAEVAHYQMDGQLRSPTTKWILPSSRYEIDSAKLYTNGTDAWSKFIQTVEDFDQTGLQYFRRVSGRPVWAIGPTASSLANKTYYVLYICFGSQNTISTSQMTELAIALEASGRNFISGFEEQIKAQNRGLLVRKWAPRWIFHLTCLPLPF
uniref:Uncharacterized protein n=1 Tax=Nelumbo nucifera TaxID=4432 RepID=A0A822YI55_NELNU|nr:TPA_asm: hypothetical protein HUJ06_009516 [Nelumbo nucifera]